MNYFSIEEDKTSGYTGYVDGTYKWGLPGVICPLCKSPWSGGFAYPLAATPEVGASGSMLDHTAIVFMSDNGEQHHSTAAEWPTLVLGGNALGLLTDGRTVIYPEMGQTNNRQVSNLFNTLGHAAGDADFNTFGNEGPTRIAPGPLSELYG